MSMTHTIRKPVVNPTRTHDYLYDKIHTLSSERDHARATFRAHTNTDRVKRVPQYSTMFSELSHHPRFSMHLEATDPVPKFISRQWRGYTEQNREALIRYTTFNYAPHLRVPAKTFSDAEVSGKNRYRYFRRPIIPFLQQVPPEVVLQQSRMDPLGHHDHMQERAPTPLTRTVEIQTDYRESETQTDPYTPEYVVRPGSQPELLTLATLSYAHGLPAGLAEVEMIERARAKRAWEETLPPLNDVSQLEKRKRMMEEMERKEWALREEEIEKLQEARLEMLQTILKEREENHMELNSKRLDKLWSKKQKQQEKKVAWIRKEHIKTIRRLTEKRRKVEGKLERRDITKSYAEYDSQVYAPMTRLGIFLDKGSEQNVVKSKYLTTYQGLLELEKSLPDFVTQPRVKAPRPKSQGKAGFIKRAQRKEKELDEVYKGIKDAKSKGKEAVKPLRFLQKIEKPIPRPPTPTVDIPDQQEEEKELAIIFLQQVIRGRAVQNMMFEGKEKRQELINELRSTHALQEAEQRMKKEDKQTTLNLQRQRKLYDQKESYIDEALSSLEGASIGDTLDFLSKELIRLQEERRIHAFAMLAERQRRIREAEESGRRQVEERRRREEDEIFKQVIKVHQNSVDTYLEDIIMGSIDRTASEHARQEIQVMADQINQVAYEMEDRRTALDSEEIVAELVHSFLLPEVQKLTIREKIKHTQRKHLLAAHKIIHKEGEEVISQHSKSIKPAGRPSPSGASSPKPGTPEVAAKTPGSSRPASVSGRPPSAGSSRRSSKGSSKGSANGQQSPAPVTPSSSRPGSASRRSPMPDQVAAGQSGARRGSGSSTKSDRAGSPKIARERRTPSVTGKAEGVPVSSKPQTPVDHPVTPSPANPPASDTAQVPDTAKTPDTIQAPDIAQAPHSEAEKQQPGKPAQIVTADSQGSETEETNNKDIEPLDNVKQSKEDKTGEETNEEEKAGADTTPLEGDVTTKTDDVAEELKDQPGEHGGDDKEQTTTTEAEDKTSSKIMADSSTQD